MPLINEIKATLENLVKESETVLNDSNKNAKDLREFIKDTIRKLQATNYSNVQDNIDALSDVLENTENAKHEESSMQQYKDAITYNTNNLIEDIKKIENNPKEEIQGFALEFKRELSVS
jgi:gamma-glutamyl:cysteine ligase YbdK (ATP-grasp superfamily)